MSEVVTLELPSELVQQARAVAAATNRRFEDVMAAWIERAAAELPVEQLADEHVLVLCEQKFPDSLQSELSELLAQNRTGSLSAAQRIRLDELLGVYRRGRVVKARAIK